MTGVLTKASSLAWAEGSAMNDFTGPEGGRLAMAFGVGCSSAWVFIRNLVMKPAIKSCHERIADLEKDREHDRARIAQLETILLHSGTADLRNAMQAALSETRIAVDASSKGQ